MSFFSEAHNFAITKSALINIIYHPSERVGQEFPGVPSSAHNATTGVESHFHKVGRHDVANLANGSGADSEVLHSGTIPSLVDFISSKPYSICTGAVALALANIAVLEGTPDVAMEQAVPALVKPLNSLNTDTLECACEALRDVCLAKECARRAALDAGAIPALIRLLSHDSAQVKGIAASALRMVCAYGPAAVASQKMKVVPIVVGLLALDNPEIQRPALHLLSNLLFASDSACVDALNSVQTLVDFVASSDSDLHGAAAQALMNITVLDRAKTASVKAAAIPALSKRINSKDCPLDVLRFACGAMRNICWAEDEPRAAALDVGLVPPLVGWLSHDSPQVQAMAASALSKICAYEPAAIATQKQQAVSVVVRNLSSNDTEVQRSAAVLLSNLCYASNPARRNVLELNAIPTLVQLIQSNDTKVQAAAAKALININLLAEAQQASANANALPALVRLLDQTRFDDTDVLEFACGAIGSVCTTDSHIREIATRSGAVPALSFLLSHKSSKVRTRAKDTLKKVRSKSSSGVWSSVPHLLSHLSTP